MLSNRRFLGNAGRSRWMAGSGQPSYAGAFQDWTRTEVALVMPSRIGVPIGYGGASLALPRIAGSLSSRGATTITLTATGNASRGLDVAGTASISIGATGAAFGVGTVAGSASITLGTAGDVYGQAAVAGTAGITIGATGDVGGVAYLSGSANIAITASSTMGCTATVAGTAYLSAAAEGATLTESGIAGAVWSAVASSYNAAGTMGSKLNTASSGGVDLDALAAAVWAYTVRGLSGAQADRITDVWQRLGLDPANPQTTTPTSIEAGGVQQSITEAAGTVTVTRLP